MTALIVSTRVAHFFLRMSKTVSDPEATLSHVWGQRRALADYGAAVPPKFTENTLHAESTVIVSLFRCGSAVGDETELVGGIAVHLKAPGAVLPIQEYLACPEISDEIEQRSSEAPCEFGCTWLAKDFRKCGLLPFLFSGALAAARLAGAGPNFSATHERAASLYEALGVSIDRSKVFLWPDPTYRTYIARFDVRALSSAETEVAELAGEISRSFAASECFGFHLPVATQLAGGVA